MVSIQERVLSKAIVNESDSGKVLKFIAEAQVVTLEMIVGNFPWIRWGDLFLILAEFRREGLVTVEQVDMILEVRINEEIYEISEFHLNIFPSVTRS